MAILHIWPSADFDEVIISTSYGTTQTAARIEPRDRVFAMLSHPAFRSIYEDVVYYA